MDVKSTLGAIALGSIFPGAAFAQDRAAIDEAFFEACAPIALEEAVGIDPGQFMSSMSIGTLDDGSLFATMDETSLFLPPSGAYVMGQGPDAKEAIDRLFVCMSNPNLTL